MKELHKKTEDFAGEKYKIKLPDIDPRFLDQAALNALDPTTADAPQKYLDILDKGHTEQLKFLSTSGQNPTQQPIQQQQISQQQPIQQNAGPQDKVSDTGVSLQHL
jgi:hypothetical protein